VPSQNDRNYVTPTRKYCKETDADFDFLVWVKLWLYSFSNYIETKREEEDSMLKLWSFISQARADNVVCLDLINETERFIQESFKPDLPVLCLRHYLKVHWGHVDENCFAESENSALKRDIYGPKANNKLHVAGDATIMHTDKRFKRMEKDAYASLSRTALVSDSVSPELKELSVHVNRHMAAKLVQQWNICQSLECIEGKSYLFFRMVRIIINLTITIFARMSKIINTMN
jgi:hypothetical protein